MFFARRLSRHADLVDRMGERTGTDLAEATMEGRLDPEDYRDAVLSCSGCAAPAACEAYLETDGDDVPGFCRNAKLFEALRP